MAKIEKVRDALASSDAAAIVTVSEDLPRCSEMPVRPEAGCLATLATTLGSKTGFHSNPPDQASAAAAAVVLATSKHGDWLPSPADGWLDSIRTGGGPGADALRLAVARAMSDGAPDVARSIDDEAAATALVRAVSAAVPGACTTYGLLGSGAGTDRLAPELSADHSPCVQKDLERKDGPGGTYGHGLFRAAEGAAALWKDATRALRIGAAKMSGAPRAAVEDRLGALETGLGKIQLKKLPPPPDYSQYMSDVHGDAGVPLQADGGAARAGQARQKK